MKKFDLMFKSCKRKLHGILSMFVALVGASAFVGAANAETAMFNGMPIEYSNATTNWVGGELVLSFTDDASLTLPVQATADVLVVGGGGSGYGNKNGGYGNGGNGGQVTGADGVVFSAGTYTIIVGGGGDSVAQKAGVSGYDSYIEFDGEELYKALRGAGGTAANAAAGSPETGTKSSITGTEVTYGTGAAAATSNTPASGVNPGDGGQGSQNKVNSGAGANGVVIVRIKQMERPSFTFQGQTIEYFGAEIVSQSDDGILLKYASGVGSLDLPKMALADYLVVGGGGSGGTTKDQDKFGASGNGGEVVPGTYASFQPGSYTITVGAGGAAQTAQKLNGNDGQTSRIDGPTSISAAGGEGGRGGDGNFAAAGSPSGTTSSISGAEVVYGKGGEKTTSKNAIYGGAENTGNGGMGGSNAGSGKGGDGVVYLYIHSLKDYEEAGSVTVTTGHTVQIPDEKGWGDDWAVRSADTTIAAASAAEDAVSVLGKKPGETMVMVEDAATVYAYKVKVTNNLPLAARIGETYYESLEDAVAASKDGDTIELLRNVELGGNLAISNDVTVASGENGPFAVSCGSVGTNLVVAGDVTFSNVTLAGPDASAASPMVVIDRGGSMVLADGASMTQPKLTFQGQTVTFAGAQVVSASDADGVILKYTESGELTLPSTSITDYLVVGGGGSGGTVKNGGKYGGSGNGGDVKPGSSAVFLPGQYAITVGAGGAAQTTLKSNGNAGGYSSISGPGLDTIRAEGGTGGNGGDGNLPAAGEPAGGKTSGISGADAVYGQGGEIATASTYGQSGAANTGNGGVGGSNSASGAGGSGVVYVKINSLKDYVECDGVTVKTGHFVTITNETRWGAEWTLRTVDSTLAAATADGTDVSVLGKQPGETMVLVENATTVYAYKVKVTSEGDPVAHIGDVYYESLADAAAAAKDGETIKLLGEVTLTNDLTIAKNVTIAAESDMVAIKRGNADANLILAGDVTFSNVTLDGAAGAYDAPMVEIARGGSMVLADGSTLTQPELTFQGKDVSFDGAEIVSADDFDGVVLKYTDAGELVLPDVAQSSISSWAAAVRAARARTATASARAATAVRWSKARETS